MTLAMTALLVPSGCVVSEKAAERQARVQAAVAEAVANRRLHIDILSMLTARYGSRTVTPDFYLELSGDTLRSYLPYLGRAYQSPLGTTPIGLNFETAILDYHESRPKAHLMRLQLKVATQEDTYVYVINVFDTGKADIQVRSQYRDPISFDGDCVLPID